MPGHNEDDFLLRGRQTPIKEKPSGHLTNSQLTLTTKGLPSAARSTKGASKTKSTVRRSLENGTDTDSGVESTEDKMALMDKTPSPDAGSKLQTFTLGGTLDSSAGLTLGLNISDSGCVTSPKHMPHSPVPVTESRWFTHSHHLPSSYSSSLRHSAEGLTSTQDPSSMDNLIQEYFPMTLGLARSLRCLEPPSVDLAAVATISPPTRTLVRPGSAPQRSKSGKSSSRRRPGSAQSTDSTSSKTSLDKMYLMAAEAPHTGASSAVLLSSPYQSDLTRLRMERLRIEEEHILEFKRQGELERIRGPKPKWYELKTPAFHYESHKNSELLRNKSSWQDMMDYRTHLQHASKKFQRKYTPDTHHSSS